MFILQKLVSLHHKKMELWPTITNGILCEEFLFL